MATWVGHEDDLFGGESDYCDSDSEEEEFSPRIANIIKHDWIRKDVNNDAHLDSLMGKSLPMLVN